MGILCGARQNYRHDPVPMPKVRLAPLSGSPKFVSGIKHPALGALENCKLMIAFALGRASAEIQAKQIGFADPFAIKEASLVETQHIASIKASLTSLSGGIRS